MLLVGSEHVSEGAVYLLVRQNGRSKVVVRKIEDRFEDVHSQIDDFGAL